MNDNEVSVRIVGDASRVAPATQMAKAEVVGLTEAITQLSAQMGQMAEKMAASMHSVDQAVEGTRAQIKHLEAEEEAGFRGMIANVHEGVESFNKFKMKLAEVAEVYMAAFAVERISEWAREVGEAAEKTQHMAMTFGMTTGEVQEMTARMRLMGVPVEAGAMAFQRLDRALLNARSGNTAMAATFSQLGINIHEPITQTQLFQKTLEGLSGIDDVPTRIGVAMQLLGKNIQEIAPMIGATKDQLEESNKVIEEFGVKNDDAQQKAMALAEAFNVNAVATQSLNNVFVQEFAPGLTEVVKQINGMVQEFIQSYEKGGAAKQMLSDFGMIAKVLAAVVAEVIGVFVAFVEIINAVAWVITGLQVPVIDEMISHLTLFGDAWKTVGQIIVDALTLNWGAIRGDFQSGLNQMAQDARIGGHKIASDFNEAMKNAGGALAVADGAMSAADKLTNALFDKTGGEGTKGGKTGQRDFDPTKGHHKPKGPKAKDELVQHLDEELTAKKVAWAKEQDAQGTAQAYSLQSEADFWATALERTNLSAKDRLQIEQKWLAARQGMRRDEIAQTIDGYRQDLAATGQNWSAKLKILQDEQGYIARMYGAQSKEAIAAQTAVVAAQREASKQQIQLETNIAKAKSDLALHDVAMAESDARFRVQMGKETKRQLLAQERDFENQRYAALLRDRSLVDPSTDPIKFQQITAQIQALERAHQMKMTSIDQQQILRRTQLQRQALDTVKQSFAQSLAAMATLQTGFMGAIKNIWQGLQNAVASVLQQIVEQWLVQHGVMAAIGKLFGLHDVSTSAGRAAAAAYASTAAIPIVGPALAPAAAATAGAGALSLGLGLMSAEGGDWQVREGLYKLHTDEMVLPSWAATPLRSMVASGSGFAGAAANDSGKGGEQVHLHLHGDIIHDPRQLKQWFEKNHAAVGAGVKAYARQGGRG